MFSEEMICSLNDLELEVYKYVVRNADKVCYMRIREFADAAHVSTSTILRFCKKAGCDGYAEFKIRLRQHLEQHKERINELYKNRQSSRRSRTMCRRSSTF